MSSTPIFDDSHLRTLGCRNDRSLHLLFLFMMFLSWLRRPLLYPRIPERLLRASPSTEDSWNRHSACPDTWTQVCGSGRGALFSWRWWCPLIPGNRRVAGSQLLPAHTSLSHACYSSASFFIFSPSVMLQTQARCVIQGRLHLMAKKPYVLPTLC